MGANFSEVTPDIAESVGLNRPFGALITQIIDNSPAAKAGLRVGDVVIGINNSAIEYIDALGYRLATLSINQPATIRIQRQFEAINVAVTLTKRPKNLSGAPILIEGNSPFARATVALKDGRQARIQGQAVQIQRIERGSPAQQFGLRARRFYYGCQSRGDHIASAFERNCVNGDQMVAFYAEPWWSPPQPNIALLGFCLGGFVYTGFR